MSETDIQELDPDTVAQIAAGEVVERPASVVKELVENSLDADADRIDVAIEAGGTERISVSDDGAGMTEADLRAAVKEHTTSKLTHLSDLERGVATLGFRGEALHTIASVSKLTIDSRTATQETSGTRLECEGGEVVAVEPTGCPVGTTVTVSDLFYNTPARRKFLKDPPTEYHHVNRVVSRYALANPDVAVSLSHDGRELFGTDGQGSLEAAVLAVYGKEVASAMIDVDPESLLPGPIETVTGLVSHPETTRSTREYLATYVNGRSVRSQALREGILEAYGTQLGPDRYPFAVLFCEVPGEAVDVNVHPQKQEVRFADEESVRRQVEAAVEGALGDHGLLRKGAPRGRSAPADATISPATSAPDDGSASSTPDSSEGTRSDATSPGESTEMANSRSGGSSERVAEASESDGGRVATRVSKTRSNASQSGQRTLTGSRASLSADFETLPPLQVLGQLQDTYIVCETPDGLALVDQHAADERINFERLQRAVAERPASQRLADPVELELTATEAAAFPAYRDALEALGFAAEGDGRTITVTAVPAVLDETLAPDRLHDVLHAVLERDHEAGAETIDALADELLADLACYPSITGNTSLTEGSVAALLRALEDCSDPWSCPHGRPVIVQIDEGELEDRFERDYPGHHG